MNSKPGRKWWITSRPSIWWSWIPQNSNGAAMSSSTVAAWLPESSSPHARSSRWGAMPAGNGSGTGTPIERRPAYYGIPDPEMAPVFPAGVIGLANRDSELFQAAVTQLRLHPKAEVTDPTSLCKPASMTGEEGIGCMGWCPYPIALARLGLAEELVSELINSVST